MTEHESLAVIIERLDNLKRQTEKDEENARSWREAFNSKLDLMNVTVSKFPCDVHKAEIKGITSQLSLIWGIIVLLVGAIVAEYFKRY